MGRRPKVPLRTLTNEEESYLEQLSRAHSAAAAQVKRAVILLAINNGDTFIDAAYKAGRRDVGSVAKLVKRFNIEGLEALKPRHGGGPTLKYTAKQRQQVLDRVRENPDPKQDGAATWSLSLLEKRLRKDGFPEMGRNTIRSILLENGFSWQNDRSWVKTGRVLRKRKAGIVEVHDPDAEAKKS